MAIHNISIVIDDQTQTIHVYTSEQGVEGSMQEVLLESIAIFGGDARNKELFIKMFGASADAAWAFGQGFKIAHSPEGGKGLKNFYKQAAAHVCQIIDPNAFQREVTANEVMNMWEEKDQSKWFGQDTEDVLEDKQVSEGRAKKKWETN